MSPQATRNEDREMVRLFGETIRRERKKAGLSQTQLGHRAGLHRTEVSLLERGQRNPRLDTILRLAGAISVNPAALVEDLPAWMPNPEPLPSAGGYAAVPSSG